jgi:predicted nucleotidyltransferase
MILIYIYKIGCENNMENKLEIIYETITGSESYGTSINEKVVNENKTDDMKLVTSDEDRKGIFILQPKDIFSLEEVEETICLHIPDDREYHTVGKFLKLAAFKQNPTILEMLFTEKRFITQYSDLMDPVIDIRNEFLTTNCYWTFSGYARDQLMRIKNALDKTNKDEMENHLYYVLQRVNMGVSKRFETFSEDSNNFININKVDLKTNGKYFVDISMGVDNGNFDEVFGMMNEMNNTMKNYNKLKNRNRKTETVKLWKHAMHLIRLLQTGIEILNGEGLQVYRYKDREMLIDMRLGKWTWDMFFEYADELFRKIDELKHSKKVPEKVNHEKVNKVYEELMTKYLETKIIN